MAQPRGVASPRGTALPRGTASPRGTVLPRGTALPRGVASSRGTALPRDTERRPGTSPQGHVRLTRRGRIVLTAFLVCVALLALGLTAAARAQAASGGAPAASVYRSMTRVVVQPGQTLWSIAVRAAPAGDPRVVMQRIVEVNALPGTTLEPGQQLWVPKG